MGASLLALAKSIYYSDYSKPLSRKSLEIVAAQVKTDMTLTAMALPVLYISFFETVIHTLREVTFRFPTLF